MSALPVLHFPTAPFLAKELSPDTLLKARPLTTLSSPAAGLSLTLLYPNVADADALKTIIPTSLL
jgi:hypothetical protein